MPATTTPQRPFPSLILLCREVESIGADAEARENYERLLNAAYDGNLAQVKTSLRSDNVNKLATLDDITARRDKFENRAPLHVAIQGFETENNGERLEIINRLFLNGALVNLPTRVRKWAPIHYAALVQSRQILRLLIEKEADVNAKTENMETALMIAFSSLPRRVRPVDSVIDDLVHHGADINAQNSERQTCLIIATINYPKDRVEYLLQLDGIDLTLGDNRNITALLNAIAYRRIDIAKILVDNGADVSAGGNFGHLPSDWARSVASNQRAPEDPPDRWNIFADRLSAINERRVPLQEARQRLVFSEGDE